MEVKGWGEALLKDGSFSFAAEINREQFKRAKTDPTTWRLEIVGNLTAVLAGNGQPQGDPQNPEDVLMPGNGALNAVPAATLAASAGSDCFDKSSPSVDGVVRVCRVPRV